MDLFEPRECQAMADNTPLADRMRPATLQEFVGQAHVVGEGKILRQAIERDRLTSLILWGPPGTGKTTLAHIIAKQTNAHFVALSAVLSGVKDIRAVIEAARLPRQRHGERTILFIDEIHRFNKAQQDALLTHVERGDITFIGATTENPSFEVIAPLLSRARVFTLHALTPEDLTSIVERALHDPIRGLGKSPISLAPEAREHLVNLSNGDARVALNILELAYLTSEPTVDGSRHIDLARIEEAAQQRTLLYDKAGDEHYNLISALHKSMRGSDPDAALYWLGRMLEAGEDPLYIVRRLIRFASEDIGNADPQALVVAVAAMQAAHFIGMPEGNLALAQAAVYLATAPKSNALYTAYAKVQEDIQRTQALPVPLHLCNAPTPLMKGLGYGQGYQYPHDYPGRYVEETYLPANLKGRVYYKPVDEGHERVIRERLAKWRGKKEVEGEGG
ncbi:MAG: replication-associated recombination protein A [Nitrospinae bacterium]|nr:replication-associated recombination protein A [Nitrospinota bacterium]